MSTTQTPDVDPQVLADKLAPWRQRIIELTEAKATIDAELEELKAAIRDTVPGPDRYVAGDGEVVVALNHRFDEKRALALIPEALVPIVTYPDTRVDKDKLRALAPEVFEAAQTHYTDRITVK